MQRTKTIRPIFFILYSILVFHVFHEAHPAAVALFSPDDKPTLKLIEMIKSARTSINAAIYMLTDKTIAEELIAAHKRGVKVKIIVDRVSTSDYGKAQLLHDNGVFVSVFHVEEKKVEKKDDHKFFFNAAALMHNKFMIIDRKTVWTGSFNWSVAANRKNQENVVISDDRALCLQFENHFTKMIAERCKPFALKQPGPIYSELQEKVTQILQSSPDDMTLMSNLILFVAEFQQQAPIAQP